MTDLAKMLIFIGIIFLGLGIGVFLLGKIPGAGKLPGDIFIKRDNFTFYFPFATCLIVSLVVSFILFLWNQR